MQAESFAPSVSGTPNSQELGKCSYTVYNLPESLRNREVLTMCEEIIHHEGANQRNFAPDITGHQMIAGPGKKNPGQHSVQRYTSKEKQREYKLRWQAKQNPEKLKEKNREYCRKYKQKQKELENLLAQSASTSNHINNETFSDDVFIMDIKENGTNRPKPLNPTVIGSSLRERMRASCRKWREKNQQRCREYFRNYRQKRKELALSMQETKKEIGEEEKERQRQTRSQWREKNREKCRQYVRNYRLKTKSIHQSPDLSKELKEKNKEWQKNWKERNKERCREYVRNYRRKRQLGQITMDVTPDITIEEGAAGSGLCLSNLDFKEERAQDSSCEYQHGRIAERCHANQTDNLSFHFETVVTKSRMAGSANMDLNFSLDPEHIFDAGIKEEPS